MGAAAPPAPRRPGGPAEVTELELRIQLLGGGGGGVAGYNINDNADLLAEILARLDGRSLAAAACVCRLWAAVARRDAVWEALCLRHVVGPAPPAGPATRAVVAALGGYRRLYRLCLGPALDRLGRAGGGALAQAQAARAHHLSLSLLILLFSIDCYERLGVGGGGAAAAGGVAAASAGVAVGREDPGAGDGPGAGAMNQAFGRWWGLGCVAAAVVVPDMAEGGLPLLLRGKKWELA